MGNPPNRFVSRPTSCVKMSVIGERSTDTVRGVADPFVEDGAAELIATADTLTKIFSRLYTEFRLLLEKNKQQD